MLQLAYSTGIERYYLFIDQFEEFVSCHRGPSQREKLAAEMNDLLREAGENTTIVATTHPDAEEILHEAGPEFETFVKFETSGVNLPSFSAKAALVLTSYYLKEFRIRGSKKDELYPFTSEVVEYAANRVSMTVRELLSALRVAMIYGSMSGFPDIDVDFVRRNHMHIFGGLENKLDDFVKGNWSYARAA